VAAVLPSLPEELVRAMPGWSAAPAGKRERTRAQLLQAAAHVFSSRGVALATLQEVAAVAGVANGTVYNHFASKEELVGEVALGLAEGLCEAIEGSCRGVAEAVERMAIGNRRYFWLAQECAPWALLLLDIGIEAPQHFARILEYPLRDIRLGVRQKTFRVVSEAAALDLVAGAVSQGMRTIAAGGAPANHGVAVAASVLVGLGVPHEQALVIARKPLPPFQPAQ
jgi:AcrR family transcriptional regulator